jgi:branched-chain amino acid transport system substrate-binding protein
VQRKKTTTLGALAAVSLALVLAACGSSDSDDATTTAKGEDVANGTPVSIGAITQSKGSAGLPDAKIGLEAATWYVNNEMGGIGGSPVKIDLCEDDVTPENAVACGNQFVSNKDPVVVDTYSGGFGAAVPALLAAKIPYVGTVSGDPTIEVNKNPAGYYWTGPLAVTAATSMALMQHFDVEVAHFVTADATSAHTYVDKVLVPMGQRIGVDIEATYVDPAASSFDTVAATLMKGDPDIVGTIGGVSEDQCTALISSLRTQGWAKPIYGGSCSDFVKDLPGDQSKDVSIVPRTWLPPSESHAPETVQKQLTDLKKALAAVGSDDPASSRTVYAFTSLVNLVQILNDQGVTDVSTANVVSAIQATKDAPSFLGPSMTCDGKAFPGYPTACANEGIFFTVQEDGSYEPGDPNGFVPLDLETLFGS